MAVDLRQQYLALEKEVKRQLREAIEDSNITSEHFEGKAIKVNVFDYQELAIINDELTFLDSSGLHYGIYSECSLEDLVDILAVMA